MNYEKHYKALCLSRQFEICRIANSIASRAKALGFKHSAESLAKMSKQQSGKGNGFYRKTHTAEARLKISLSKIGIAQSPAQAEKSRKAALGYKYTAEQKIARAYQTHISNQARLGYCKLDSKENFLALEAYLQYAK